MLRDLCPVHNQIWRENPTFSHFGVYFPAPWDSQLAILIKFGLFVQLEILRLSVQT